MSGIAAGHFANPGYANRPIPEPGLPLLLPLVRSRTARYPKFMQIVETSLGMTLLGMAGGSLAMAAYLGPRFTLGVRGYYALMSGLVFVGELLLWLARFP